MASTTRTDMHKPKAMTVATSIFIAGLGNALVYTLGFLLLLVIQFAMHGGEGATFGGALTSLIVTLLFTLFLSSIITFVIAFPIAAICLKLGFTGVRAHLIAPAVGAAIACAIASLLGVVLTTYIAIIAFAYISSAIMWLTLRQPQWSASALA